MNKKNYNLVSFFSGVGGFDYGFHKKGFNILLANDFWEDAANSFKLNYPSTPFIQKKIEEIKDEEVLNHIKNRRVDVLIGGPPCQCFTRLNNNLLIKQLELKKEDDRRVLSQKYIDKVALLNPKIVLMENVRDMLVRQNQEGELYKEIIKKEFKKIGYESFFKIISMEEYGVPQKRKRVIFLATNVPKLITKLNEDEDYGFPQKSSKIISSGEALKGIEDNSKLKNHEFTKNDKSTLIKIKKIPQGGYYEHLPDYLKTKKIRDGKEVIVKRYGSYLRRLDSNQPSTTITNNYIIHPTKDRYLSNREKAILHGFPKNYKFYGKEGSVSQQVANAVPPKFSILMARKILKLLDDFC